MARPADPERRRRRVAAIVASASELFAEHGYEATTLASIARGAGLGEGTIYHYFADKAAVFRAIFERDQSEWRMAVSSQGDDPLDAIQALLGHLLRPAADPTSAGLVVELLRRVREDESLAALVLSHDAAVEADLAALLHRAQSADMIDPAMAPEEAAHWLRLLVDAVYLDGQPDQTARSTQVVQLIALRFLLVTP